MTNEQLKHFVQQFEDHSLPAKEWTHKAHLIVSTFYVTNYDFESATNRIRENIKNYNLARGGKNNPTEGYHETITIFYMEMTRQILEKLDKDLTLPEKIATILASPLGDTCCIFEYFTKEYLFSPEARLGLMPPDLKNF